MRVYKAQQATNSIFNQSRRSFAATAKVEFKEYDTHRLDANTLPKFAETNKEDELKYFKEMAYMRRTELTADQLYKSKFIRGFCHLYDGQEAIASGMEAGLTWQDCLIGAYRVHCQAIARGDDHYGILAEMMQKRTGSSSGKGGSMHYYNRKNNFYGGNGIVGAQVPVGAGLAFALKYKKQPNVAVTMYGDGAANQGQVMEAANIAQVWKLPLIFVIENNRYGMGTSVERASMNPRFFSRGD